MIKYLIFSASIISILLLFFYFKKSFFKIKNIFASVLYFLLNYFSLFYFSESTFGNAMVAWFFWIFYMLSIQKINGIGMYSRK
jgi:4-hydroxybenzoate polyprenyltransferase